MKRAKRNIVLALVLVFVGAAVYLNWSYNSRETKTIAKTDVTEKKTEGGTALVTGAETGAKTGAKTDTEKDDAGLYYEQTAQETHEENEQLSAIRLSRRQARDEAAATFKTISEADGASQEVTDKALSDMTKLTERTLLESELESRVIAKGYSDCVVYITDDGITVTVAGGEGLDSSAVAQITDIVMNGTECSAQDIRISEIK